MDAIDFYLAGVLRDAETGRLLQRITAYEGDRMIGADFSPDGRWLVTSGRRGERATLMQSVMLWRRHAE